MELLVDLWGREGADILIKMAIADAEYANAKRKYYILERLIAIVGKSSLSLRKKVKKIIELYDQKQIFVEEMKSAFNLRVAYSRRLKEINESLSAA